MFKKIVLAFAFLSAVGFGIAYADNPNFWTLQGNNIVPLTSSWGASSTRICLGGTCRTSWPGSGGSTITFNGIPTSTLIIAAGANTTVVSSTGADGGAIVTISAPSSSQWTTSGTAIFYNLGSVGIGTASSMPSVKLEISLNSTTIPHLPGTAIAINGPDNGVVRMGMTSYGIAGLGAFAQRHARGTAASPTAVQNGDQLMSEEGWGYGSSGWSNAPSVMVRGYAAETWTDSAQGSALGLWTTPIGSIIPAKQVNVSPSGYLGVGTADPSSPLHVIGTSTIDGNIIVTNNVIASGSIRCAVNCDETHGVTFTGNGAAVSVATSTGWIAPFPANITGWQMTTDQACSSTVDVYKAAGATPTGADLISSSTPPTISNSQLATSTTLTGWTTSVAKNDVISYHQNSTSTTCQVINVQLTFTK